MQKIISLFQRNYDGERLVRNEVTPGAEWVVSGRGVATVKWDGTCCLIRGGKLFKRYEVKPGKKPPPNFEAANDVDENTGKQQGWLPVGDGPEDQYHREAINASLPDGTYELIGPKIQGNAEKQIRHHLVRHGMQIIEPDPPRTFDGLKRWFAANPYIEGIVWHDGTGRMVKIKLKDFGLIRF